MFFGKYLNLSEKNSKFIKIVVIFLLIGIVYYPALFGQYVWDDVTLLLERTSLNSGHLTWAALATPVLNGTSYFRPLVFFTFWCEFHTFGVQPFLSHFINLSIHALNSALVYVISVSLLKRPTSSWWTIIPTAVYALHPALIESVVWVSGRFDLMANLFGLLAVFAVTIIRKDSFFRMVLVCLSIFLSLLSKEIAIVVPVAIFFILYVINNSYQTYSNLLELISRDKKLYLGIFVVVLLYFVLRKHSMGMTYHLKMSEHHFSSTILEYGYPLRSLVFYLKETLLPFYNLGPIQPANTFATWVPSGYYGLLIFISFFATSFYFILKYKNVISFGIFLYLLALFPVMHVIPINLAINIGSDRLLTMPLAFLCIGLTVGCSKISVLNKSTKMIVLFSVLVWFFLSIVVIRSILPFWNNERALWYWMYKTYPEVSDIRNNYLAVLLKQNDFNLILDDLESKSREKGKLIGHDKYLYAVVQMNLGNPKALLILRDLAEEYDSYSLDFTLSDRDFLQRYGMAKMTVGSVYINYAQALLRFSGNVNLALQQNVKSMNYFNKSESAPARIQYFTLLVASNKEAEASKVLQQLDLDGYYRENALLKDAYILLGDNCRHHTNDTGCFLRYQKYWHQHKLPS